MRFCITAFVFLIFSVTTNAALLSSEPSKVCNYLKDIGLVTGGWRNHYDNEYGCFSPYKAFGSGAPLANNLAYYVEGDSTTAKTAKLVLNINNKNSAVSAHEELLKAAEALSLKMVGSKLSETISTAIKSGANVSEKAEKTNIQIVRIDWSTGKGYEIRVLFN